MIGSNQWFQQLQDVCDGDKPDKPKYRDLSDLDLGQIYNFAFYNGSVGGQRNAGLRAVIAADRALQLKPKTVKCRLFTNVDGVLACATERHCPNLDVITMDWIGPIFEREL